MSRSHRLAPLLLQLLPGLLIPGICVLWLCLSPHPIPQFILLGFAVLQGLYILIIEWYRHEGNLTSPEGFEAGNPKADKCAILVHGFADTPQAWRREADALAAKGWRVCVPELSLEATSREWSATLEAALRDAKAHAQHVELWGHSMGGAMALVAAQRVPVDRLVLWAPFLAPYMGTLTARTLHTLHRLLFIWPFTFTWFPVNRHGKGDPETFYRVRRVIPVHAFSSALAVPRLALQQPPTAPLVILLSQRDTVVDNAPVRRAFPKARFLLAANPRSSHALTNAADWEVNLNALIHLPNETCDSL